MRTTCFVQVIIDNYLLIDVLFSYQPSACLKKKVHQHELVRIENFSSWRIKAWSCQWMNEWMNEWLNDWVNEWMNERMDEWMDE